MAGALKRFAGKVSLITGASDGLGFECAKRLGLEGSAVVITGRNPERLDKAVTSLKALNIDTMGVQGHVGDKAHREDVVKQMLDKHGKVDNFIASAATNPLNSQVLEVTESKWDHIMNVNVKSAFHLTQMVVPSMKEQGGGAIVLISSAAGSYPGYFYEFPIYGISKAALNAIAVQCAPALGDWNIRINSMPCGYMDTKFASLITKTDYINQDATKLMCIKNPGRPEDAGSLAAFLCSDEAKWITGELVHLHGGLRLRDNKWKPAKKQSEE